MLHLELGQRHDAEGGGGDGLADLVDGDALNDALVLHLEVVHGEEAAVRLVLDLDPLRDEDRLIVLLPQDVGLGGAQGLGSKLKYPDVIKILNKY